MTITLSTPDLAALGDALAALRDWQSDETPMQLHPGDIGWFWRFGAEATAAAVRTWSRDGRVLAVGLLDGPALLRVTTAPEARHDEELAQQMVADLATPERGVLPAGRADVEAPADALVQALLEEAGWDAGEPWTPLRRDLCRPVEDTGARVEVVGPGEVPARTAVQRAAFERSTFTDDRWRTMAAGPLYTDARCLVLRDGTGAAAAAITVWSAGPGRTGLIEPMGVDPAYRGRGHGTAVTVAGAAALRRLGSSSAVVATPTSNVGGVATYAAAGFEPLPQTRDRHRAA
jgi:GNAT superfamily N-acetyltransferase